jgi:hypothetical protein
MGDGLMPTYVFNEESKQKISDGHHTFEDLYLHRMVLFAAICNQNWELAWKSWKHHDDTMYDDYFIVGIETPEGSFTYHYHKDYWGMFEVPEVKRAPMWDGHTSEDVVRLLSLADMKRKM